MITSVLSTLILAGCGDETSTIEPTQVSTEVEPAGDNCTNGGVRIVKTTGADTTTQYI